MNAEQLKAAGFNDVELVEYNKLTEAGFSDAEIVEELSKKSVGTPGASFKLGTDVEGAIPLSGSDLPTGKDIVKGVMQPYGRVALETVGMVGGGAVGLKRGAPIKGAALGYAGAKSVADAIEETAGLKPSPSMLRRVGQGAVDVGVGGLMEMGGQTGTAILKPVVGAAAKGGRALMGRITGTGTGAVEEALAAGAKTAETGGVTSFDKAMKGEIPGEEIVNHARTALQAVRSQRAAAYKTQLDAINQGPQKSLDISPIRRKAMKLLDAYGLRISEEGELLPKFSGSELNKADMVKVQEIMDTTFRWGKTAGDRSPSGVDTLKRYYDNYYSDSSAIRQLVTSLKDETKQVLVKGIPGYEQMTKGYAEATNVLKDFESGLLLRKQGMSGRVTADQTLRRLISAMKDNYELRRDLVKVLGARGDVDLTGEVAGYAMSQVLPRGLAGASPFLIGEVAMAYKLLSPQWWPILALSSPRVAGEFLKVIGSTASKMPGMLPTTGKAAGYGSAYGMSKLFNTDGAIVPEDTVPPVQLVDGR